jgi:hypothetical protein
MLEALLERWWVEYLLWIVAAFAFDWAIWERVTSMARNFHEYEKSGYLDFFFPRSFVTAGAAAATCYIVRNHPGSEWIFAPAAAFLLSIEYAYFALRRYKIREPEMPNVGARVTWDRTPALFWFLGLAFLLCFMISIAKILSLLIG